MTDHSIAAATTTTTTNTTAAAAIGNDDNDYNDDNEDTAVRGDTNRYEPVYEFTPHKFEGKVLFDGKSSGADTTPSSSSAEATATAAAAAAAEAEATAATAAATAATATQPAVTQEVIFGDGSAFVLHNLMSPEECKAVQAHALKCGLNDCGYSVRIRRCDRVSVMGKEFAEALYARALPFLKPIVITADQDGVGDDDDDDGRCVLGGPSEIGVDPQLPVGTYVPYGLNPCFRVVRYKPGGFFLPHFDGGFAISHERLSLKTFMIYLNDGFKGGPTTFFNSSQEHYEQPEPENVVHEYFPACGSCLVFNHHITHDGGVLLNNQKWLLRTEVMYRLVKE